jgi:threonylcarbamoyladenosine tRNA methylthiotransferase MtaB
VENPKDKAAPRAKIITLGCKVNQFESAAIREALTGAGYAVGDREGDSGGDKGGAELYVLNACAVTLRAEKEAFRILRKLRRESPDALIVAAGCLSVARPEKLSETGADLVIGNAQKDDFVSFLEKPKGTMDCALPTKDSKLGYAGSPVSGRTRAFLKIQDGCDASCSYCAVPLLRGPSRSQEKEIVLSQIRNYVGMGYKEIVFTGIHLGQWGKDLPGSPGAADLLKAVNDELDPLSRGFRMRLSSLEPNELLPLVPLFGEYPWLARHAHVPLQAGTDKILSLMNRPYDVSLYEKLLSDSRRLYPDMCLGSDVLAGFPGETGEDFSEGLRFIESLPLNYLHVFPFSARPGTVARDMKNQVSEGEKKERVKTLKSLDKRKREAFAAENVGRTERALTENTLDPATGRQKALTGNYLKVFMKENDPALSGLLIDVKLEREEGRNDVLAATPVGVF